MALNQGSDPDEVSKPTRRSKRSVNYRRLNLRGHEDDSKEDIHQDEDDNLSEAEVDIDDDDEDYEVVDEGDFGALDRKFQKRRIPFALKSKRKQPKKNKLSNMSQCSYDDCKDQICAVCATIMDDPNAADNLYEDKSPSGKVWVDLCSALLNQDMKRGYHGSKVCGYCVRSMTKIEKYYEQFRNESDAFLDSYLVGQKRLDEDMMMTTGSGCSSALVNFVDLSNFVLKVINPSLASFDATAIKSDFRVFPSQIFHSKVIPGEDIGKECEAETTALINYGQEIILDNGISNLNSALFHPEEEVNPCLAQVYMTQSEYSNLYKGIKDETLHVGLENLSKILEMLFLGKNHKSIVSKAVTEKFLRLRPKKCGNFICSDCLASFYHMHALCNHVQHLHNKEIGDGYNLSTKSISGEVATLEKPFQCNQCKKCFSEYVTLSTHIDHYHGFTKACNVEGCKSVSYSKQDFVEHYVRHSNPEYKVPTDHQTKRKVTLSCPVCNISIQGVWKFFYHTFTHDQEAQFKCPVCEKRMRKIQTFQDHLVKHHKGNISLDV